MLILEVTPRSLPSVLALSSIAGFGSRPSRLPRSAVTLPNLPARHFESIGLLGYDTPRELSLRPDRMERGWHVDLIHAAGWQDEKGALSEVAP